MSINILWKKWSYRWRLRTGEVGEYVEEENNKFATNTANAEIINAITLADFYFLKSDPVICFEMKNDFRQKKINGHRELTENLENDTEIDCLIRDEQREFKFQLKQYPEQYKEWSADKVTNYLDESILPRAAKYNNDSNKDLIIVITIKPELKSGFKEEDFDKIYKYLSSKEIKLLEINFLYNRNIEHMVWHQVFPKNGYYKIPWQNLSYHKVKS